MRNELTLFIFFIGLAQLAYTQTPSITWQRTLGGSGVEYSKDLLQGPDGSLFICGFSDSNASGEKTEDTFGIFQESDIWIIKLDSNQNILWDKTIGGDRGDYFYDAKILNNKIYLFSASFSSPSGLKTSPNFGLRDFWLVCMDFDGNVLWDESYGGEESETPSAMELSSSGNLLLFGQSSSDVSGNKTTSLVGQSDLWIVEVDPEDGSIVNQGGAGSENFDYSIDLCTEENGNITVMGAAGPGTSGDKTDPGYGASDVWLVQFNSDLEILQDFCLGGDDVEYFSGDIAYHNNRYYVLNPSQSAPSGNKTSPNYGNRDYWLVCLDNDWNILWDKSYGGELVENASSISFHPINRLIICGGSNSPISGNKTSINYGDSDVWIVITDLEGNEIQQASYGGANYEDIAGIYTFQESPHLLNLLAFSDSDASGVKTEDSRGEMDYWLVQIDASDHISVEEFKESNLQLKTYPNPFVDEVHFDLSEVKGRSLLSIYSGEGKLVFRQRIQNQNSFTWRPENTQGSTFFYELKAEENVYRGKLIKN